MTKSTNNDGADELFIAIEAYYQSCMRTGHHDDSDNINYFTKENDHMNLDLDTVRKIYRSIADITH